MQKTALFCRSFCRGGNPRSLIHGVNSDLAGNGGLIGNRKGMVVALESKTSYWPLKAAPDTSRLLQKMLLVMKLTVVLLVLALMNVRAEGYSQMVTFSGKNVSITRVFSAIESQTGYTIFANKDLLKGVKPVSITARDMPLADFLQAALANQPISFEIHNKTIFITEKEGTGETNSGENEKVLSTVVEAVPVVITGTVRNNEGAVLEGATVTVKGTNISVVTNASGQFTINAEPNQTLVISYVGHQTLEVPINNRTTIDVVLQVSESQLDAVVVTALGITRKSKALTYNVQELKSDQISAVNNGSFVNSLVGKVAGATINSSSAGVGASTRVVLRGVKSISGNNNALFVIDGIPMPNDIRGQAEDIFSGAGQTGDFVSNLNPEDIESVTVLSGPSAAASYGSAGANGVILITTKKGRGDRTDISISNTTSFSTPLILPRFQNTYGLSETGGYYSWGEKLSTPSTYHPKDFFQTGVTTTSALTLSTGSEKNQTYLSLGNTISKGIIPNNNFDRSNLTLRNTSQFMNGRLNLDVSFMAGLIDEQNMISQGQYFNPLVAVYLFPAGEDFNKVRAFERYDASRNLMTQFWPYGDNGLMIQNPFWVTQRDLFQNNKERYMTTVSLRYQLADWINLSGRVKMDKTNEKHEKKFAASTNTLFASETGYYSLNTHDTRLIYAEAMAAINKQLGERVGLNLNLGTSVDDVTYNQYLFGGKLAGVPNLFTYANVNRNDAEMSQSGYKRQKQSVFATSHLNYDEKVYLELTGRNDWASTLAATQKGYSFFYPSVGLSGILSEIFNVRSNFLSYLKVRGSYSEVGNEPPVHLTISTYELAGGMPVSFSYLPFTELQPERTKSFELGLNAAFFRGALKLDATVYKSRTFNQIFDVTVSQSSSYDRVFINAGRIDNEGIEASLAYTGKFGKFNWTSALSYSLNRNKIVEMVPNWTDPTTGGNITLDELDMSGTGSYKMVLRKGGSMGDIFVNTLRVDEHGAIYVDPGSQGVVGEPNKFVYAGNNNPLYNAGWNNTFSWNGISLNVLFTARVGGIVVSNTQAIMDAFGASQSTADARDAGGALVNGRPVPSKEYYSVVGAGASGGIASMYVYSATNVRLGELSLGYDLPVRNWLRFVKSANVSLVGRNLLFLYNAAPFDPELTANTQTYYQGIDYFMAPSLRSLGFSVKLNF